VQIRQKCLNAVFAKAFLNKKAFSLCKAVMKQIFSAIIDLWNSFIFLDKIKS
jgi:hypothetical protein